MVAFEAAVELFLEIGTDVVEKRVLSLARQLGEGLAERGYELVEPWPREPGEASGIVSFRKPGAPAQEILRDLNACHVVGRIHQDFVRLGTHFYNTEEEVERVLELLSPQRVDS
jgi:selenocysteine lyase/cysteine desulfurase